MTQKQSERYMLLVDVETTGLNPEEGYLLEVGVAVATRDFDIVDDYSVIIQPDYGTWPAEMDDFVRNMHDKSGLTKDICERKLGMSVRLAEQELLGFVKMWMEKGARPPMCGSSVHFDRRWLEAFMPDFEQFFHYRNIDFSTVKELCRRLNPKVYDKLPPKVEAHRVIPDLHDTASEAKFYADNFLWLSWEDDERTYKP